jgi:hypothetical protein
MRDTLKTKDYWNKIIEIKKHDIEFSQNIITKVINEKGSEFHGVKVAYIRQRSNYMMMMRALYTSGASLDEIIALYPAAVDTFTNSWSQDAGYVEMLWIISVGIMLDIDNDVLMRLGDLIKRENYSDCLFDFLINSVDSRWDINHFNFNADIPYAALKEVIQSHEKVVSQTLLKEYLETEWYIGHDDSSWFNSHKDKESFYCGYWSFESGAIAKIMGLDDSGWENLNYYPYDMVHYTD